MRLGTDSSVKRVFVEGVGARAIVVRRTTGQASTCASLYEAFLSKRHLSPNSLFQVLSDLRPFLDWICSKAPHVESLLLAGCPPDRRTVYDFSNWLCAALQIGTDNQRSSSLARYNRSVRTALAMCEWFIKMYAPASDHSSLRLIHNQKIVAANRSMWFDQFLPCRKRNGMRDIPDRELAKIDSYLGSSNYSTKGGRSIARAQLIFRLALDYGLRISEILSLRTDDCPSKIGDPIKIVRIEDRLGPPDPRRLYAPRPKTQGRHLSALFADAKAPRLIADYLSDHRYSFIGATRRPIFNHSFLLVNDRGAPLSLSTACKLAKHASRSTGIDFTWHDLRHAFFNRLYERVADSTSSKPMLLDDMQYFGGWASIQSLEVYSSRARRDRAASLKSEWNLILHGEV